ncbi:MAG: alpha/beta hydrolase-fold protein [Sporolactobacillus sp.]
MRLHGKMTDQQFISQYSGENYPFMLYQPEDDRDDRLYSILIALDGRDYVQIGRLVSFADTWMADGLIKPLIIIAIPYANPASRWSLYHPQGDNHRAFYHFLTKELPDWLCSRFPIDSQASAWTLIGDSLAATCSLLAGLGNAERFGNLLLQSPYIDQPILDTLRLTEGASNQPMRIVHLIGRNERAVRTTRGPIHNFVATNHQLYEALLARTSINYTYIETNGDHSWRTWQSQVPRLLFSSYAAQSRR